MPGQTQVRKTRKIAAAVPAETAAATAAARAKSLAELDAILDEIDEVLEASESTAAEFVKAYVQRNGE